MINRFQTAAFYKRLQFVFKEDGGSRRYGYKYAAIVCGDGQSVAQRGTDAGGGC